MRILSLKIKPVAKITAILYAAFSPLVVLSMLLSGADYLRLPLGLIAPPLAYFSINFDIQRPTHFFSGVLFMVIGSLCYAGTGWVTGAVGVLFFNFIARRTGGIDSSFVATSAPPRTTSSQLT